MLKYKDLWVFSFGLLRKTRWVSVGFPSEQNFTWMNKYIVDSGTFIDSQKRKTYKFPYRMHFCIFCKKMKSEILYSFIHCWVTPLYGLFQLNICRHLLYLSSKHLFYCQLWEGSFFQLGVGNKTKPKKAVTVNMQINCVSFLNTLSLLCPPTCAPAQQVPAEHPVTYTTSLLDSKFCHYFVFVNVVN